MTEPAVRNIQPERDENLIKSLESWLEDAKAGKLVGAVLLGNLRGNEVMHCWSGLMPLSISLLIFEQFKRRALADNE